MIVRHERLSPGEMGLGGYVISCNTSTTCPAASACYCVLMFVIIVYNYFYRVSSNLKLLRIVHTVTNIRQIEYSVSLRRLYLCVSLGY